MHVRENDPTAPTPYTNRLALSQAWYDALHLAREHAPRSAEAARAASAAPAAAGRAPSAPSAEPPPAARSRSAPGPAGGLRPARAGVFADDARGVTRAVVRRRVVRAAPQPKPAAPPRAIVTGSAHVAVRIAFSPHGLVVALACAPEHRARAGDALERARLALAARGIATVRTFS